MTTASGAAASWRKIAGDRDERRDRARQLRQRRLRSASSAVLAAIADLVRGDAARRVHAGRGVGPSSGGGIRDQRELGVLVLRNEAVDRQHVADQRQLVQAAREQGGRGRAFGARMSIVNGLVSGESIRS